eukprot:GHVN01028863.1.p3 GENE.GHVN01028863.1~~GHVN01028863.1.p3  ORF type:complete len:109 (+),score=20.49 GHVN01028863.1:893-1219(+)
MKNEVPPSSSSSSLDVPPTNFTRPSASSLPPPEVPNASSTGVGCKWWVDEGLSDNDKVIPLYDTENEAAEGRATDGGGDMSTVDRLYSGTEGLSPRISVDSYDSLNRL